MFCPHCKRWEIGEADVFCSWCRAKLVDFALSLDRNHLYVGDPHNTLNLTVKHTGTVGVIELGKPHCDEPWITVDSSEVAGMTLRLNGSIEFPVSVDVFELPDQYHDVVITVPSSVGEREIHLRVVPRPEMQAILPEYTLLLDNVPDKVPGYLALTRGVLTVEALSTDVPWAIVKLPDPSNLPVELDERGNSRLEIEFVFDEELITTISEGTLPAELSGNLIVKYLELEPERTYPFHVNCFLPPLLLIAEELSMTLKRDVFTDKRIDIDLTLQNGERDEQGRAELEVLDIRIDVPWLQLKASVNYPLTVGTGQYNQISFTATTTDIGEGAHIAKIVFLTNTPGERQKETFIEVNVRQMVDFDRVLAIDFGTVNSCCATFDKLGSQILIDIDRREYSSKPTTAPSTILYWDKVNGVRDYDIGNYPYEISYDPLKASSTVKQVKRSLGKADRYTISYYRDPAKQDRFSAREVAADVLKRILERAETQLEGRVNQCIISHPSRFSLKQIDDLKNALTSCGIKDENIQTMHEPVGAALNFLQENRDFKCGEQYHLMVYDFGGGTTDITLLHVTNRKDEARGINIITPRVLGASGDRWLGGEDVTDLVMQLALDRCHKFIRGREAAERGSKAEETLNIVIPFDAENFNDPRRRGFAYDNRMRLRRWAEAAKIEMSTHDDDSYATKSALAPPVLHYLVNNKSTSAAFDHQHIIPRMAELNEELRPKLDKLVEMMKRLAKNNKVDAPDVVLLSGMSSALPIVRKIIEEAFPAPRSEIYTPQDLKECVVKGASHFTIDDAIAGVYLDIDRDSYLSATTSRLGIRVSDAGQTKFKEIIDAGVPIGQSGLTVLVTGAILRRNTRIRILENTGLDDELVIKGKENPNITELRVFRLDHRLAEWERVNEKKITDQVLLDAKMELEISPNLRVRLIARVPEVEESFEFEAEFPGW